MEEDGNTPREVREAKRASVGPTLLLNVATVCFLLFVPPIGLVALWTLAPWNRRARIIATVVCAPFALYYPVLVLSALIRGFFV